MPPTAQGRVLQRVRGFMNCVERVRRENAMVASFLTEAKAFTDEAGNVICKLTSDFALMMLGEESAKAVLLRALSAELKRPLDARQLTFEVPTVNDKKDTILDDLLEAAEQQ